MAYIRLLSVGYLYHNYPTMTNNDFLLSLLRRQDQARKVFEAAVVGAFRILRETAGRQLPLREVIREAIATDTFFRTAAVGAIAPG